ncbi:hypothetical protein M409DRAFT_25027 [Zasmidium cellare ATCC 36951]|uniref:Uncharacterized protein n=1 Tax=Zasmidium cellare ATCC 36951 TaxID=1080233 RepID=A0A6A6CEH3_ZASCE|nr:uncharacterized protein M409DRAFT_25027 [Zasmidium cellare ATCC 36951]KAF2164630.1 hypothetical protein M409DRAFT_25027 [Zasmidium cellare ATCC 36951]
MSQPVAGMTAFWAILALALNAMARPSFASRTLYDQDSSSEGSFVTHLSSPVVCLVDCFFELVVLARVLYRACCRPKGDRLPGHESSGPEHKPKHDSIAVRSLLFILGGLPQAVKIAGMRGIPTTQTLSAIFLASTILATVSELLSERAEVEKKAISSWLRENRRKSDLIRASVFLAHGITAATAWNMVSNKLELHRDTPGIVLVELGLFVGAISVFLSVTLTLVWILGILLAPMAFVRWFKILVSPIMASLPFLLVISYPRMLLEAGDNAEKGRKNETTLISMVWHTAPLILLTTSGSYVLAAALVRVKNILTKAHADEIQSSPESEPQSQITNQPSSQPNPDEGGAKPRDAQENSNLNPDNQVSAAELSQHNTTVTETVYPPSQQNAHLPNQNTSSNSNPPSPATAPTQKKTRSRYRISDTHWNWLLVGYSFWNFRSKIPAALRHQWKTTRGPFRTKFIACLSLSWHIFKLFALQTIWFLGFMLVNIFDVSPIIDSAGRLLGRPILGRGRFGLQY